VQMILLFHAGYPLQSRFPVWGVLATEWLLVLLPVLLTLGVLRLDPVRTLRLRRPSVSAMVAAVLLGVSAWLVLGQVTLAIQNRILPMPASFRAAIEKALGLTSTSLPDWQLLAVFALSPALCEEALFRGLVFSGLGNGCSAGRAVALTGVLFGLFHISIYRVFPTAVLGVLLTWVVYRSGSIWPAMVMHGINNAVALLWVKHGWAAASAAGTGPIPERWFTATATLLFAAGLLLLARPGCRGSEVGGRRGR